jgi:putative Ca2+/H+ antiporter (TMEM165/GDT1 family)
VGTVLDIVLEAFAVSVFSTAAAEFGDKTQLGLIMLAASLRNTSAIFFGMIAGYAVVAGVGVLVGQALLMVIPLSTLTLISGVIFVAVGLLMLKVDVKTDAPSTRSGNPFRAASLMIVLTELGDKTQIITIALAARFAQPIAVFSGVLLAFAIVDGVSIMLAGSLGKRLPTSKVKKVSAVMFIVLGILTFLGLM